MENTYVDLHREWLQHPLTQMFMKWALQEVEEGSLAWRAGQLVHDPLSGAQVLGKTQAMELVEEYVRDGLFIEVVQNESSDSGVSGTY